MPESPLSAESPFPPTDKPAKSISWFHTFAICCAVACLNVGGFALWSYFCGLTWRYPAICYFPYWFLIALFVFITAWTVFVRGKWQNTLAVFLTLIFSFDLILVVHRLYDPYERGLAEALRRADLQPVWQWAAAHRPSKGESQTLVSVESHSIPEDVWRAIPYKGSRPYFQFLPTSEEDDWMLKIDHSGGFVYHNGFILTFGKDIDPTATHWVIRTRSVAPHLWVFAGQ